MENIGRLFAIFGLVFILMTMIWNFLATGLPRIPGDIYLDKVGLKLYIPWLSSIIIAILFTLLFNFLKV